MITRENIKEVVASLSNSEKECIASCDYEYVILTNSVFNVGSVVSCECTNTYCGVDESNSAILSIDDPVFSEIIEEFE